MASGQPELPDGAPSPSNAAEVSASTEPPRSRLAPWILLLVVGLVISIGITRGEFHFNGDEMRHAVTGVFFRDLLADRPFEDPRQYVYDYYAKYPALGLAHWPPFFHFVEGVFFLIFGISAVTSRLTVLFFSLLGVYFWYRIAEREGSRYRALAAAFIFSLVPYILLYERVTMLEIPMVALCLGAIHFWRCFRESGRAWHLWAVAAFSAAAMLTSQKAVFLVFIIGADFLLERRFDLLRRWDLWAALAASAAVVLPWYWLTFRTLELSYSYQRAVGRSFAHVTNWQHLVFYPYYLPQQIGYLLVALSVAGLYWTLFHAARRHRFLVLWVVAAYICYTLIQEKDLRHSMIWIPPLVYFAVLGVEALCAQRRWALVASAGLAAYFLVGALRFDRPKIAGMEEAAQFVTSQPESDVIYYQGAYNGNFIFYVRKFDPEKRRLVAREKQVVAVRIIPAFGKREIMHTPQDFLDFVRTWGIRYAVVENRDPQPGMTFVRAVLHSDQFELVRRFPVWTNNPDAEGTHLLVYRYRGEIHRGSDPVVVPMLTLRDDIRADLSRLAGRPWPH